MAAEIPASINIPSVAFEIPIEKKEISCPPTVQIRLAGQLDSPRKETSLDDINKKLSDANKRKQESLDFDVSKVATHNAKVYSIFEKAKEQENEKARSLEERITSKLSDAESRKDSMKTSWIERLSQTTIDKLQRGSKVKADEEWSAKELGAKIDIKSLQADLRREELKLKTREELAAANHDKLGKSQIAANAAEVEAKKIVACTEQKISAAEHRRDKNQILVSARISESAALKKEKVDDMLKREKEQRRKLNAEIQEKVRRAAERKEQTIAEKIEALSAQTSDKLRRAAAVGKLEEEKAKEKSEQIRTKVELANQRRDDIIREQQEILKELAGKKERLVIERQKEEEKAIKVIGKMIRSKMHSANQRKEIMRASKVESIKSDQETKQARAKDVMQMSLNEAKELRRLSDKRMNKATKKKNAVSVDFFRDAFPHTCIITLQLFSVEKLLKAMVDEKMDANKSKASTHIICKRIHVIQHDTPTLTIEYIS